MYARFLLIIIFLISYAKSFQQPPVLRKDYINLYSSPKPHWLIHCSGGSDSMYLLHYFKDLLKTSETLTFHSNITAVYFNHRQRDNFICKNESDTVKHLSNDKFNFNFVNYPLPDNIYELIQKRKSINSNVSSQNILRNWRYQASLLLLKDILRGEHLRATNYEFYPSIFLHGYEKVKQIIKPKKQFNNLNVPKEPLTDMLSRHLNDNFHSAIRDGKYEGIIVTGHHKDDQLETILLKLIRGVNILNLRGMKKVLEFTNYPKYCLFRPFLEKTKKELREILKDRNISWHEDETNTDTRYLRNDIRSNLIPLLSNLSAKKIPHNIFGNEHFSALNESSKSFGLNLLHDRFDALTDQVSAIRNWIDSECMKWESEHQSGTSTIFFNLTQWRNIEQEFKRNEILHRWVHMKTKENINYSKLKLLVKKLTKPSSVEWNWRLSKSFNLNYKKDMLFLKTVSLQ